MGHLHRLYRQRLRHQGSITTQPLPLALPGRRLLTSSRCRGPLRTAEPMPGAWSERRNVWPKPCAQGHCRLQRQLRQDPFLVAKPPTTSTRPMTTSRRRQQWRRRPRPSFERLYRTTSTVLDQLTLLQPRSAREWAPRGVCWRSHGVGTLRQQQSRSLRQAVSPPAEPWPRALTRQALSPAELLSLWQLVQPMPQLQLQLQLWHPSRQAVLVRLLLLF